MKRRGILGGMIAVVLAVMMVLALGAGSVSAEEPTVVASGNCGVNGGDIVTWSLDSTGLLTIRGQGAMKDYTYYSCAPWNNYKILIKSVVIGKNVTSIGSCAFEGCSGLTSITIPESVTSIGGSAFYDCSGLTSITIPESVASIGSYAFSGCSDLTSITIPDGVTSIGSHAFYDCSGLTSITIPESVTSIGYYAFSGCSGLTSITIPESVTSIESYAFSGCSGLTSITIPESVTSIESYAFSHCSGLTSITIPESVARIRDYAFSGCSGLTSITIPESVTSIGSYAFSGCTNLKDIYYGGTETMWAKLAVSTDLKVTVHCGGQPTGRIVETGECGAEGSNLTWSIDDGGNLMITGRGAMKDYTSSRAPWNSYKTLIKSVVIGESVTSIESYAFYDCSGLASITIPESVTSIESYAFSHCSGLTSITIPESVTSIESYAFSHCSGLTSITIPESVTSIGYYAFSGCSGLTSITIPDSVTSIESYAFSRCSGLTNITIPDSVTTIGKSTFYGCTNLKDIYYGGTETMWVKLAVSNDSKATAHCGGQPTGRIVETGECGAEGSNLTWGIDDGGNLTVSGKGEMEDSARPWNRYRSSIKTIAIGDDVTSIGESAFADCSGMTSVTIGEGVTSIGDYAFKDCVNLTEIHYNAKAVEDLSYQSEIFDNAGTSGKGIEVIFGDSVERIPAYLFYSKSSVNRPKVTGVIISNSVTSIGSYAFSHCSGLTSITIPESVTSIRDYAFSGCSGLTSITIPESVTSIESYAFSGCSGMTSITIPESVTSIGSYAFSGCSGMTSITIPESVTSIGGCAFSGCSGLTSITIPDGVTSIGWGAFKDCVNLTEIHYNAKAAKDLSNNPEVFYNAGTLGKGIEVIFGDSVERIPAHLFYEAKASSVTISNSVTRIGRYAFAYCSGLTSVTIGEGVTSIGDYAFKDCVNLTEIHYNAKAVKDLSYQSEVFYNAGTSGKGIEVIFGDSVERIPAHLFYCNYSPNRPKVTDVTISNSVTSIGESAFADCSGMTSVTIGEGVTRIGRCAFAYCSGLTSIIIPDSVTSIGESAFADCSGMTSVTIGEGVTSIGSYAFNGCTGLTEIIYNAKGASDLAYDSSAFSSAGLSGKGISVIFGEKVKKIPNYLFYANGFRPGTNILSCIFKGEPPIVGTCSLVSSQEKVYAFYPYGNLEWTEEVRNSYKSEFIWAAFSDAPVVSTKYKLGKSVYVQGDILDIQDLEVTISHVDGCVETVPYASGVLEAGECDFSTLGAKIIDISHREITIPVEVYVHEKKSETLDKAGYPESSHDYENDLDKTYTYTAAGAISLDVTFSEQTEVETNIDYLYVNGTKYTGKDLAGKTIHIDGDTLTVRLVSDKSDSAYGFSIDSIVKTYMGHEYADTTVAPTCTEQGYTLRICPCGNQVKQDFVPVLGHDMVTDAAVAPTCTETGLTEGSHCSRCDEATTAQKVVDALGHDMVTDAAVAPTCTKTGLTEGSHCSRCDEATTAQEVVDALGHDMVTDEAVAPTCTETGLTEGSHCSRCDEATTAQKVVDALGHDMVTDAAVAPTCTKTGLTEGSHCSRCNEVTTAQEVVDARGHSFTDEHICPACGAVDELEMISMESVPATTRYVEKKGVLDVTGGKIRLHYASGTSEILALTADMVSGFDNTVIGPQELTVTVGGRTTTFTVEITERSVTSVSVENSKLVKHYSDGTTEESALKDGTISEFEISDSGKKTLTLSCENACVAAYKDAEGNYVRLEAIANEDGSYHYIVPEEVAEVTVAVKGDLDGDGKLNMKDIARLRRDMADEITAEGITKLVTDLNGDGVVNMKDMGILRRYLAGGYGVELDW